MVKNWMAAKSISNRYWDEVLRRTRLPRWVNRAGLPPDARFRSAPINGHLQTGPVGQFRAKS